MEKKSDGEFLVCPICVRNRILEKSDGTTAEYDRFRFEDGYFIQKRLFLGDEKGFPFLHEACLTLKQALQNSKYNKQTLQIYRACKEYIKIFEKIKGKQ